MQILYSFLYTCALAVSLPYFLMIGLIRGKYLSTIRQRLGFISLRSSRPSIWVHAVSVGEFLAAKSIIKGIQAEFAEAPLFVSTTTITAQRLARDLLPDSSFYFPFDWKWCHRRVFRLLRPKLILVLETEIWPNFLWEAERNQVPVILVNGRISDRSYAGYRIVRRWMPQFQECYMQSEEDAVRMEALGASRVEVTGNLKYDFHPPSLVPALRLMLSEWKQSHLLWIAGSTMKNEEEIVVDVFCALRSHYPLKLLIAPRHPERFDEVARLVAANGIEPARRSENLRGDADVMILDSIGELAACYEVADLALIGGTLTPLGGGHNPIEPAYFGKPIIAGRYYANFRSIFEEFRRREAIRISEDLKLSVQELLQDPDGRRKMGESAAQIVKENSGATEKVLQAVRRHLHAGNMVESISKLSIR